MKIKIDLSILKEQIYMCDIHTDNASSEEEREVFDGISNLLDEICFAIEREEDIEFVRCEEE